MLFGALTIVHREYFELWYYEGSEALKKKCLCTNSSQDLNTNNYLITLN